MKYEVVLLDMDDTILVSEKANDNIWPRIHNYFGVSKEEDSKYYNMFMDGGFGSLPESYTLWTTVTAGLWFGRGKDKDKMPTVSEILAAGGGMSLAPGMGEFITAMRESGVRVGIVSAGLQFFVDELATRFGLDRRICLGNSFELDGEHIAYPIKPIINVPYHKDRVVWRISKELNVPLGKFVGVDDSKHGYTLPKTCRDNGGLGVAFAYKNRRVPKLLADNCDFVISDFRDLVSIVLD